MLSVDFLPLWQRVFCKAMGFPLGWIIWLSEKQTAFGKCPTLNEDEKRRGCSTSNKHYSTTIQDFLWNTHVHDMPLESLENVHAFLSHVVVSYVFSWCSLWHLPFMDCLLNRVVCFRSRRRTSSKHRHIESIRIISTLYLYRLYLHHTASINIHKYHKYDTSFI